MYVYLLTVNKVTKIIHGIAFEKHKDNGPLMKKTLHFTVLKHVLYVYVLKDVFRYFLEL